MDRSALADIHVLIWFAEAEGTPTHMIRIGLYSEDRKLQSILSSALGNGFKVLVESDETGIQQMLLDGGCDVVILDLDSNNDSLEKRLACSAYSCAT